MSDGPARAADDDERIAVLQTLPGSTRKRSSQELDVERARRSLLERLAWAIALAGAVAVLVPFAVAGAPVAIAGGVAGLASGLGAAVLALRSARRALFAACACVAGLGATQLVRGATAPSPPEECASPEYCAFLARSLEHADAKAAFGLFVRACDLGEATACTVAGEYWNDLGKLDAQDPALACAMFERGCAGGDRDGCTLYAINLAQGRGVPRDQERALAMLNAACDAPNARACRNLGHLYHEGQWVPRDDARAEKLYERACDLGSEDACGRAGALIMQQKPPASPELLRHAFALIQRGCDADPEDCTNLGLSYQTGNGTAVDGVRARAAYTRACDAGFARPCHLLSILHRDGIGGPVDSDAAAKLLELACDRGYHPACARLKRFPAKLP